MTELLIALDLIIGWTVGAMQMRGFFRRLDAEYPRQAPARWDAGAVICVAVLAPITWWGVALINPFVDAPIGTKRK